MSEAENPHEAVKVIPTLVVVCKERCGVYMAADHEPLVDYLIHLHGCCDDERTKYIPRHLLDNCPEHKLACPKLPIADLTLLVLCIPQLGAQRRAEASAYLKLIVTTSTRTKCCIRKSLSPNRSTSIARRPTYRPSRRPKMKYQYLAASVAKAPAASTARTLTAKTARSVRKIPMTH